MKQVVSISLLFLFAFVGASSISHQLEQHDDHCSEIESHICAPDGHHHCSLCDSIVTLGFTTTVFLEEASIVWTENYVLPVSTPTQSTQAKDTQGRAPPCI